MYVLHMVIRCHFTGESMTRMMVALGQAAFVHIVHIGMPVMLSIIIYQVVSERGVGMMCVRR